MSNDHRLLMAYDSGNGDVSCVLRPSEFESLYVAMAHRYPRYFRIPVVLLLTGMRYAELQRFTDHEIMHINSPVQQWFIPQERMIDPMGKIISFKQREKHMSRSRRIYLSDMGVRQVRKYLDQWIAQPDVKLPSLVHLDRMLNACGKDANFVLVERDEIQHPYILDENGEKMKNPQNPHEWMRGERIVHKSSYVVSEKIFRKTSTSWKIVLYPQLEGWIASSMGHSVETARRYYQERGFSKDDIKGMIKYFEGMAPPTLEEIKAEMEVQHE